MIKTFIYKGFTIFDINYEGVCNLNISLLNEKDVSNEIVEYLRSRVHTIDLAHEYLEKQFGIEGQLCHQYKRKDVSNKETTKSLDYAVVMLVLLQGGEEIPYASFDLTQDKVTLYQLDGDNTSYTIAIQTLLTFVKGGVIDSVSDEWARNYLTERIEGLESVENGVRFNVDGIERGFYDFALLKRMDEVTNDIKRELEKYVTDSVGTDDDVKPLKDIDCLLFLYRTLFGKDKFSYYAKINRIEEITNSSFGIRFLPFEVRLLGNTTNSNNAIEIVLSNGVSKEVLLLTQQATIGKLLSNHETTNQTFLSLFTQNIDNDGVGNINVDTEKAFFFHQDLLFSDLAAIKQGDKIKLQSRGGMNKETCDRFIDVLNDSPNGNINITFEAVLTDDKKVCISSHHYMWYGDNNNEYVHEFFKTGENYVYQVSLVVNSKSVNAVFLPNLLSYLNECHKKIKTLGLLT